MASIDIAGLEEVARSRASMGFKLFNPYPLQSEFIRQTAEHDNLCLSGANRCLTPWTLIETPEGPRPCAEVWTSEDQSVLSWDGERECVAQSSGGLFLGIEQAFRVVLGNGRFFDCSRRHRVLTTEGWISLDQLVSISDGQRLWDTPEDYQASCVEGGYLCDRQLPFQSDTYQAEPRRQSDVRQCDRLVFDMPDEAEHILEHIRSHPRRDHLSTPDDLSRFSDLFALFSAPFQKSPFVGHQNCTPLFQPFDVGSSSQPRLVGGHVVGQFSGEQILTACLASPCSISGLPPLSQLHPLSTVEFDPLSGVEQLFGGDGHIARLDLTNHISLVGGQNIVAVVPIGLQPIVDATVAPHSNYIAAGVVHHNTGKTSLVGRYLLPVWLTGDYPDDWEGRRWERPIVAWCGSTDWTTNIDGCQRALLGDVHKGKEHAGIAYWDKSAGAFIPPGIPAEAIDKIEMNPHVKGAVSRVFIKNKFGGTSEVRFISYLQGRERLQAGKIDVAWPDEEPPEDVNTELSARTIDSGGLSILTFTPLKGISEVVKSFIGDATIDANMPSVLHGSAGVLVRISAYDVPHLGAEKIEAMKRRYPKHEWPARIDGIPALGEGAIYPFDDAFLTIPSFEIPAHWRVLDAVDFGFQHPTARVRAYMNPDTREIFIAQVYKDNLKSAMQHAREWETQFKWRVPVVWPHDGRNTETDGTTKRAKYVEAGVRFTVDHVHMPGQSGDVMPFEGSVQLVYELMHEGKLKIFQGLFQLFAEKALYRREKKGQQHFATVVKTNDDVMDAMRYVICGLLAGMGVMVDTARRETPNAVNAYGDWQSGGATYADFDPFDT